MSTKHVYAPEIEEMLKGAGFLSDTPTVEVREKIVYRDPPSKAATSAKGKKPAATAVVQPPQPKGGDPSAEHLMAFKDPTEPADYIEPVWAKFLFHYWTNMSRCFCVLMSGARGTGKTVAAEVFAARIGRKLLIVNCNGDMTATSMVGRSRVKAATDYWFPGPLMLAALYDAVLLLDEFNLTRSETQAVLNPLTDAVQGGIYNPATSQRVVWKRPMILIAANEGYSGTKTIQQALRDRCRNLNATYLPEEQEIKLVVSRTACDPDLASNAVRTANAIRAAASGKDGSTMPLDFDLSPRALFDYCEEVTLGRDKNESWFEAVIGRIGWNYQQATTREGAMALSKNVGGFDFSGLI